MKKFLLATTAIVALAAQAQFGHAADPGAVGYVDFPTTIISFEGGYYFNASPENTSFDKEDEKLGNLGSLQPGAGGGQGRVELGQRLNGNWDYKVGLSAIILGADSVHASDAEATQQTMVQTADLEVGYRPDDIGQLRTRIFAGLRGLHSTAETDWSANDTSPLGNFSDENFALGPRLGVDLVLPLNSHDLALVGSASGSLLFANAESDTYSAYSGERTEANEAQTIWNVEAMAGVSLGIGENADFTLGYRVAEFGDLMSDRSDIDKTGDFSNDGQSDLLLHGPFARLTVEIP